LSLYEQSFDIENSRAYQSQPFSYAAMTGACSSPRTAETVDAIAALCGRTFRGRRTILRALYRLPFAIHIRAVIGTFWLRLLLFGLMLLWLIRWLLRGLGERREQDCSKHKSRGEAANKSHSTLAF
jgi:hypothetical protein